MAAQLRETVRAAFAHFDADGSGAIDTKELRSLVAELGGYLTDRELATALSSLDRDGNGVIDEAEFTAWWTAQHGDLDGDGQVGELERAMERVKASGQDRFRIDLHAAAWRGAADTVTRLLESDAELVHEADATEYGGGNTALHYAAYQGHADVCKLLLAGGAKVNAVNAGGCTPLFFASQQSRLAVVTLLIEHGADIRIAEKQHQLTAVDVCSSDEILACFRGQAGGGPCVPEPPRVTSTTATSISIEWTPPVDKHDQITPMSGYKLKVTAVDAAASPTSSRAVLVGALPTQHTIDGLAPDTTYSVQLAAINLHGISAFSVASDPMRTRAARPAAPSNVRARALDASRIEVSWTIVPCAAAISHYIVQQCVDASMDLWKGLGRIDALDDKDEASTGPFVVAGLLEAHTYRFRVAAVSSVGLGQSDFCVPVDARTRAADGGADAKRTPRAEAGTTSRAARGAVRDLVGAVQRLRSEAKRSSPTPPYPRPMDAKACVPRAAKPREAADRTPPREATNHRTAVPEKKETRPDRGRHAHDDSHASELDEDEYVYFSDSEEEEGKQQDERCG